MRSKDLALAVFAGFAIGATAAHGQATSNQPLKPGVDVIDEIIVTAQKRSESLQKVPVAVTAISGADLDARGNTTLASLGQSVPGLNVSEDVGQARLTIRGIGLNNVSAGSEGSVAFNQDGVFYSRSAAALASFYDIQRVEVLRGPQGTLYGRNATGGSVNIETNRPSSTLSGALNVTAGNYSTINTEGFINGPLSDTVSGRLSFQQQDHSGYGKNVVTGTDIDNKNSRAIRGQLLFTPGDPLNILFSGDYYRSSDRSNIYHYFEPAGLTATGQPVTPTPLLLGGFAPATVRDIAAPYDPHSETEFYGGRIDMGYALSDSASLRSLSAYRHTEYASTLEIVPLFVELFPLNARSASVRRTRLCCAGIEKHRHHED